MRQNILHNSVRAIDAKLYNAKYYDYMLYRGGVRGDDLLSMDGKLMADFSSLNLMGGRLYSDVSWSGAVNEGVELNDIGLTAMDNGFIKFRKDRITNKEFLDLYLRSKFTIESGDTRFFMTPVTGNTLRFEYPMYENVEENGNKYLSFKGGFYQGFYKLEGYKYQTLPNKVNDSLLLHFDIRPRSDYEVKENSLNAIHGENSGIFFYIGTRAENKFWNFCKTDSEKMEPMRTGHTSAACDTVALNDNWLTKEPEKPVDDEPYIQIGDDYLTFDEEEKKEVEEVISKTKNCTNHPFVFPEDYMRYDFHELSMYTFPSNCGKQEDEKPTKEEEYADKDYFNTDCAECCLQTYLNDDEFEISGESINYSGYTDSEGFAASSHGYTEITTDNKFILFNRTETGYTVDTWTDGTKVTFKNRKPLTGVNYFLLFNRTETGYTTETIEKYEEENQEDYNIYKDIRGNAFGLRITEDGKIGYRYGVLDCSEDNSDRYKVIEEYSKAGIIKNDEWNSVNVKFVVLNPSMDAKCDNRKRKMKIYFYVNGYLKFISKEVDALSFKALDEEYQKQEGVPYNISLGGGTQGLLETILPNYYAISDYILPLEKDFCGTFYGDIKSFKIYGGNIDYPSIKKYL